MDAKDIVFQYAFRLEDGADQIFEIRLDPHTLDAAHSERDHYPSWTDLDCCRCDNCPLDKAEHPRCPIAVNLVDLVDFFKASFSYEEVDVQLETEERHYTKRTTAQRAVSSLLGIYMVTSGCPIMDRLRPMVRFHLPFSTPAETTYRVISMYLMAQYFREKNGLEPDWKLADLVEMYRDVHQVNAGFVQRLNQIESYDASANALIILDSFAGQIEVSISEEDLSEFEVLFAPYLKKEDP